MASISGDGRYVAFQSVATNLVAGDTNGTTDIFVRDREEGVTTRVSVSSSVPGQEGLSGSGNAAISSDGRYVAFESLAPNLVTGDLNAAQDIFVHDRQTATTTRVSVATDGTQGDALERANRPALSADGRFVTFDSPFTTLVNGDTKDTEDIFVHDRLTSTTTRVSVASDGSQANGNGGIQDPSISADGRYVSFTSVATNLVSGDTNNSADAFVHDRRTATTSRVSATSNGTQADGWSGDSSGLSDDGRYVVFTSSASNLVVGDSNGVSDVFIRDTQGIPGPTPLLVAAGDVSVYEGDVGARVGVFTVSLSEPHDAAISVNYATVDGTARAETDYASKTGTLVFVPGMTSLKVKVSVTADTADEFDEAFNLSLFGADGATIADGTGTGTIVDDDPKTATGRRLAIGDVSVYEGDGGTRVAVFNVSLSKPAASAVTVDYSPSNGSATHPADYIGTVGTLVFAPGVTSRPVKVTINPDTEAEGNHSFTIVLSKASLPKTFIYDGTGVGTIIEDD